MVSDHRTTTPDSLSLYRSNLASSQTPRSPSTTTTMNTKRKRPTDDNYDYLPATGPLSETNRNFHRAYGGLVAATLERLGGEDAPVIIVAGDTVHLLWNGEEEKARIVSDQYHNAKAFSHLNIRGKNRMWLTVCSRDRIREPTELQSFSSIEF
jgi:hypothetical protein